MMLESLRAEVCEANLGLVAIKPSGVPYETLRQEHLVITDLDGRIVEGNLKPSSDLPTHLALYRAFPAIGGVVHTHSRYATAWAQAGREIPCLGTTHADYFHGPVPVTDRMQPGEIESEYEWNTGQVILRRFAGIDPMVKPGVLVAGHAPFCWGRTPAEAAHNAVILEEIACLAYHALTINPQASAISDSLRDKHFLRKHGPKAYYGQK
jgi:L-ribulose-5-phosphate 4-epimerase